MMNKKEIAALRRQFKADSEQIVIRDVFNVYVQKESGHIFHHDCTSFELLEKEFQDLLLNNCKKVLTGHINEKLFTLRFTPDVEDPSQQILYAGLITKDREKWQEQMIRIVEKLSETKVYDFDTVVTFIYGNYRKPVTARSLDSGEGGNDNVYENPFIICSLNKTTKPEMSLVFDYIEKEFRTNTEVDPIINLTKPLTGFLFPAIIDGSSDINHLLYAAEKANKPDDMFIENVLNCKVATTAAEEKDGFGLILSKLAGDQVNADLLSNIYQEISTIITESEHDEVEIPHLDYEDVEHVLSVSGIANIDSAQVKETFKTVFDNEQHTFNAGSLLPKKVNIKTDIAKISLDPTHLKNVKYITHEGKRCLLIEIEDGVEIEGFELESSPL